MSARLMDSICCCPPDMVPANWRLRSASSGNSAYTSATAGPTRSPASMEPATRRLSSTDSLDNTRWPSGTAATPARRTTSGGQPWMVRPSTLMRPWAMGSMPATASTSSDLPAPLAPSTAVTWPRSTDIDTLRTSSLPCLVTVRFSMISAISPAPPCPGRPPAPADRPTPLR